MIVDAILDAIGSVISRLLDFLPDVGGMPEPFAGWSDVLDKITALNYWLPIFEVFTFVVAVFFVAPAFLAFRVAEWAYDKIRGSGS